LLTRIITALIGIPVLLYIIISGGLILNVAITVIALIGVYEIYRAFSKNYRPIKSIGYLSLILVTWASFYDYLPLELIFGLLTIMAMIVVVKAYPKYTIIDVSLTIFGVLYLGFLFPFVSLVREMAMGEFLVWLIFISAWGTDTFAYFTGYFLGKNKLAPVLSPKKTIEGAIGGVIGAALLAFVYTWLYGTYYNGNMMQFIIIIPVITALSSVVAQLGDLSASAIKRLFDVKDFGSILPGHGGILDRFDSVLFAAPFIYAVLYLIL